MLGRDVFRDRLDEGRPYSQSLQRAPGVRRRHRLTRLFIRSGIERRADVLEYDGCDGSDALSHTNR